VGEQVCERCGGHYYPRGGRQRFCSAECRFKSGSPGLRTGSNRREDRARSGGAAACSSRSTTGTRSARPPVDTRHAAATRAHATAAATATGGLRLSDRRARPHSLRTLPRADPARTGLGLGSRRGRHLSRPVTRRLQSRRADAQRSESGGDIARDEDVARVVRDRP
jgi:hypothetical protein